MGTTGVLQQVKQVGEWPSRAHLKAPWEILLLNPEHLGAGVVSRHKANSLQRYPEPTLVHFSFLQTDLLIPLCRLGPNCIPTKQW